MSLFQISGGSGSKKKAAICSYCPQLFLSSFAKPLAGTLVAICNHSIVATRPHHIILLYQGEREY